MSDSESKSRDQKIKENIDRINRFLEEFLPPEKRAEEFLIQLLAVSWTESAYLEHDNDNLVEKLNDTMKALQIFTMQPRNISISEAEGLRTQLLLMMEETDNITAKKLSHGLQLMRSAAAQRVADARHDKPGGSREKQRAIREIWQSGEYTSRDICAEQECAALGMSFSTARKALRNTPNPKE